MYIYRYICSFQYIMQSALRTPKCAALASDGPYYLLSYFVDGACWAHGLDLCCQWQRSPFDYI